jgi:hypothetical protein
VLVGRQVEPVCVHDRQLADPYAAERLVALELDVERLS